MMGFADLSPHHPFIIMLAALVGAAIGSFITLVTHRLPRGGTIGFSRSRCTHCHGLLGPRDLIPMLSWAWSRAKCRLCGGRISARYPLTELACALGAVAVVAAYGLTLEALAIAGLWWCIVALIITDLEHYIILDEVQLALVAFGALHAVAAGMGWQAPLGAAAVGVAVGLALKYGFLYFMNKDGLGMGDVKFLGVAGIWLADPYAFVPFLFFSGLFGIVSGVIWRALHGSERFPFGPALAFALLLCVILPEAAGGFWQLYGLLAALTPQ